jgi:hypothetical protein
MSNENNRQCKNIIECSAPLCIERNNADGVWFPNETICKRRCHVSDKWIKKQRRIARKSIDRDFFFTRDDLERVKRVNKKIKGKKPDTDYTQKAPPKALHPHLKPGFMHESVPSDQNTLCDSSSCLKPHLHRLK